MGGVEVPGVALVVAVVAVRSVHRRRWRDVVAGGTRARGWGPIAGGLTDRVDHGRARRRWARDRSSGDQAASLARLLVSVSAALRAGSDPAEAWSRSGVLVEQDGVPRPGSLAAVVGGGNREAIAAVIAGARVAAAAGAPLAAVLDRIRQACETAADVDAERAAALAGPRASGRLLGWLPVGGVLVAAGLGADPIGSAIGGGAGTVAAVAGLVLLGLGRWWLWALVAGAERAGVPGGAGSRGVGNSRGVGRGSLRTWATRVAR